MALSTRTCRHCSTVNFVATCPRDGRPFALTPAHAAGGLRSFDDPPLIDPPSDFVPGLCDYCSAKAAGMGLAEAVSIGLRQKTCPNCHREFFSDA